MGKATALPGSGLLGRTMGITYQRKNTGLALVKTASPPAAFKILILAVELGIHYATIAFTRLTRKINSNFSCLALTQVPMGVLLRSWLCTQGLNELLRKVYELNNTRMSNQK